MALDKRTSTEQSDSLSDEMLMAEVQSGQRAMTELDRRYRKRLLNWLRRLLLNEHEAEEAVQKTFMKAWRGANTFTAHRRFKPWLFSIAKHACTDIVRRRQRLAREAGLGTVDDDDDNGSNQLPACPETDARVEALDDLAERLGEVHAVLVDAHSRLSTETDFENFAVFLLTLRVRLAWEIIQSGFLDEEYSDELAADVEALPRIVDAMLPWSDQWKTLKLKRIPSSPAIGRVWKAVVASGRRRDQWEVPARLICDAIRQLMGRQQGGAISPGLWWRWEWLAKNCIRDLLGPEKTKPLEKYLRVQKKQRSKKTNQRR
ncbi:MAG TPA: RNA polymerase sigma factor [Acidobacteriota bacterium]|nr:RNA polymerase sigma factor [Acidobacteriota bacterium]